MVKLSHLEQLRDDFIKLIRLNRLSHSYIFFGGDFYEGEKVKFAFALANFLENGEWSEPKSFLRETLLIKKDDESPSIGIEEIRNLTRFLYQRPVFSKYRVAIVSGAEDLTLQAEHSLLKITEEPPSSGLIIFIARSEHGLFPTLLSRAQRIYFPAPAEITSVAKNYWRGVSPAEAAENEKIDEFFVSLISDLKTDPIKNFQNLRSVLRRLSFIKQWNTNKKLQLRALRASLTRNL